MSIQFACPQCGHPFDVGEQFAEKLGHCKHCGAQIRIPPAPAHHDAPPATALESAPALRLRPIEGLEAGPATPAIAPGPALRVRPVEAPEPAPSAASSTSTSSDERPIEVLDPYHFAERQAHREWLNPHYETRVARYAARFFRKTRDRLYLLSLAFLVLTLIAFLCKLKPLLHLGTMGVVASNALMLVDGLLYLLVLPFRESFAEGVGATIFPPYHWIRHWDRMRHPFFSTVRSFVPVLLAALIWFGYEEAPLILSEIEQVEKAIGMEPKPAGTQPRRPNLLDDATKALGGESNIIQELAKP